MASSLLGGMAGSIFMIIPYLIARWHYKYEGMGQGDIYLAVLIGAATGFPLIFLALIIGIIIGGLTAILLVITRRRKKKDMVPFGPFEEMSKQNIAILERAIKMFSPFLLAEDEQASDRAATRARPVSPAAEAEQIEALRSKLNHMQKQLDDLTERRQSD